MDVLLGVDMNGLVMTDTSCPQQTHRIQLQEITKWSLRHGRLLLYTRSRSAMPVPSSASSGRHTEREREDDVVVLLGSAYTLRAILDTLTSCCMQLAEILEHDEEESERRARRQPAYVHPSSSSIAFWHEPDFAGWMFSQGDVIKTWRKRWFVMKDGYLFRFSGPEHVGPDATPRGVLDLSTVEGVNADEGRERGIRVVTRSGVVSFLAEDEDGQVQWISALEEGMASVLRKVAGVDGERARGSASCIEKLEKGYTRMQSQMQNQMQGAHQMERMRASVSPTSSVPGTSVVDRFRQPASLVERREQSYGVGGEGYGGMDRGGGVSIAPQVPLPEMIQIANVNFDNVAGARQVQASAVNAGPLPSALNAGPLPSAPDLVNLMDEPSAPALQSPQTGWETFHTADGTPYYHNRSTGATSWTKPI